MTSVRAVKRSFGKVTVALLIMLLCSASLAAPVRAVTAANDAYSTNEDTAVSCTVLTNDTGTGLVVDSVGTPAHGTATIGALGADITYTPNANWNGTDSFTYTVREPGTPYYSVNGHYYEFVSGYGIDWNDAEAAAALRTLYGLHGYLVTITDAGEQAFVQTKLAGSTGWMGASDAAVENEWRWVTGPEDGTLFSNGETIGGGHTDVLYDNWAPQEPNDSFPGEDYAHFLITSGEWNDYAIGTTVDGYVVEYGGMAGDAPAANVLTATVTVTVNAVNDAPSFTGGESTSVTMDEDENPTPFSLSLDATDIDGDTLTWSILTNATNGVATISGTGEVGYTPNANWNGSDHFHVQVSDGALTDTITVNVTVNAVNDAPSFTGPASITVLEDSSAYSATWATAILAGPPDEVAVPQALNFVVTNSNNPLFSSQPAISSTGVLTFTPAANMFGSATVTVVLHDNGGVSNGGVDTSVAQIFTITVTPVNDFPSFTAGSNPTVYEDCGVKIVDGWATAMSAGPANESDQNFTFVVTVTDNPSFFSALPSITPAGSLSYCPALNRNGTATISVTLEDSGGTADGGHDTSSLQTFTITINPVNDAPSFTKGLDQTVLEDCGAQSVTGWATAIVAGPTADELTQSVTFTVTNSNNALFSSQPAISSTGVLTFTPVANAYGTATVTVILHDDGGILNGGVDISAPQTFVITVSAVNDQPSFTAGPSQTVYEDCGTTTVDGWATNMSAGPANESSQNFTFIVTNNTNPALFGAPPVISSTGVLTYTPALNQNGIATITVALKDSGGTLNGGVDTSASPFPTFTITVIAVNDAPSFTKGIDQTVLEDCVPQTVSGWATTIVAGPTVDELTQVLHFDFTNSNNALFLSTDQPAISPTGVLTFTPAPNMYGTATVTVRLHDNGGILNGGADISAPQTFVITVSAVNDQPSFTQGSNPTVYEDCGAQIVPEWATALYAGAPNESSQNFTFIVTNNTNPALFGAPPAISSAGMLLYAPALNQNGHAHITVALKDSGGTLNGGVDTSASVTFIITVLPVNDVPSFKAGLDQTVLEDCGPQAVTWASAIVAGPTLDELTQALDFTVTNSNNALFSVQPDISPDGTLTYTPAPDMFGSATITVVLKDNGGTANGGVDTSVAQIFTITVVPVNDIPSFTMGPDQTVLEDCGAQTIRDCSVPPTGDGWATAIYAGAPNEFNQNFTFIVTNDNGALFSAQPVISSAGVLLYAPAANQNGHAHVTVTLRDSGGILNGGVDTSPSYTFTITVVPVNDAPSFTPGLDQTVLEDCGLQTVSGWATTIVAGPTYDELSQALDFIVSNSNNTLFAVQPAVSPTGILTYTPAANQNGTATITVNLHDNGGVAHLGVDTSPAETFTITVTAVNDIPSFTKGADQTVLEDCGVQSVAEWAKAISAGPANESTQNLDFTVTNSNNALFSAQPAISPTGILLYAPAANQNGSATVTVTLKDSGGIVNSGVDTSISQTFVLTVREVNDSPIVTNDSFTMDEDATLVLNTEQLLFNDFKGPENESSQSLYVVVTAFAIHCTVDTTGGVITIQPTHDYNGPAWFEYTIRDDGTTAGVLDARYATGTVTLTITPVNDIPFFTKGADQTVLEDCGLQTVAAWATGISAGAANESSQVLTFTLTNSNPALFSIQPACSATGTLTYVPAPNAFGTATVTVTLTDDATAGGPALTTAPVTFTITVTPVNDAPSFTGPASITVFEDSGTYSAIWATAISTGALNEVQSLDFIVTNDNTALFSTQPAIAPNGTLTFAPAADANGIATVTVRLHDNGGTLNGGVDTSAPQTFTITVIHGHVLTVTTSPSIGGTVTIDPDLPKYPHHTVVTLTATPAVGYTFTGWSGDLSGTANPATLETQGDIYRYIDVVANFAPTVPLFLPLSSGWNLVSSPVALPVASIPGFQAGYGYHDGWLVLSSTGSLVPGEGYWIQVEQAGVVPLIGTPGTTPVVFTYQAGWQLLGNPFDVPLPISTISNYGLIQGCFSYGPTWAIVSPATDSLQPGKGYWIELASSATQTLIHP
jgi:hypothetical protein